MSKDRNVEHRYIHDKKQVFIKQKAEALEKFLFFIKAIV